jgi:chromosome segregation ATPase
MTVTDTDPRLDQLRQQCAQANERIRDLAGDLRAAHNQCDTLTTDLADALAERDRACDRLAFEQRRAAAALTELHQARTAFTAEHTAHQATIDEAAAQVATLTSQIERLEAALRTLIDDRAVEGARIVSLECERAILLHRLDSVRVACDC